MRRVFPSLSWSRIAFLLAALGSSLGWLQVIPNWTPGPISRIDFWLINDHVFFNLAIVPHFAFVTAGMCVALSIWLDLLETARCKNRVS